ncbi:MAG TPA: site-specific DNA-methyltransferase [Phycisphaerales bacterium]
MAKKSGKTSSKGKSPAAGSDGLPMGDIRHPSAKRRNIPPAKIAAEGTVPVIPKAQYAYNPHLPPVLRFDQHGKPDALQELLAKARRSPLTDDEARTLAEALRIQEPWLEWTGKREKPGFAVDPVALHIHERISAQAILKVAARQDASKFLFADPEQEYHEAVQFYRHDVDWANRLILGDSLQVMSSLARREDLAGKVQMIYMDPPYGIKFASNFQPEVGKRDVKDKQEDLTREPEMVRAYRDTWHLGIHSYLSYLRDRLVVARELLADTGSIFVQISDENVHRVRALMDEVFGSSNFCGEIAYVKTSGLTKTFLPDQFDILLWYARDIERAKYHPVFFEKSADQGTATNYGWIELPDGRRRGMTREEKDTRDLPDGATVYKADNITSSPNPVVPFVYDGRQYGQRWKTNLAGLQRLGQADRLHKAENSLQYVRRIDDFPAIPVTKMWSDTATGNFTDEKLYVVQSGTKAVARCVLMTTDPGDLVLDPTCGSGTTAFVAEQWGRRWITIDTSRVAVAVARQRLLTAKFEQYKTKATRKDSRGLDVPDPSSGFHYKTVPHITLKSIAQNVALDPIFAKHEPLLDAALKRANAELAAALKKDPSLRPKLAGKLAKKEKDEGKRAVTDADRRRWVLPPDNREKGVKYTVDAKFDGWYHWEMPFDTDTDWPKGLAEAMTAYRAAWRAKMDEVNACIAASAEQEELVDQPEVVRGVTRVSGPFSVEAVQPPEMTLGEAVDVGPEFGGAPEDINDTFEVRMVEATGSLEVANVGAYLDQMIRFLRADGVRFLNNKQMKWTRLEPLYESGKSSGFHAEGRWVAVGDEDRDPDGSNNVGVVFGPQYGPVTAKMVEELIKPAGRLYDHLVVAAFNFTAEAQAILNEGGGAPHPKLKIHFAHIRPDINPGMNGLLKESVSPGGGQLFTVFGQPRVRVDSRKGDDGTEYAVTMEGVDVYNPVDNSINSTGASKVAAWFLDGDYDGRTFCVTQAFFPDKSAWEKLQKALNGKDGPIDAERFEAFSSTTSLPFPAGKHKCAAVKVIDPRGNEVMSVHRLA